jgi:putative GTP pyrophosphokinase
MDPDPEPVDVEDLPLPDLLDTRDPERLLEFRRAFTRFSMVYGFAIDEISTKIDILRQEYAQVHDYNPIEHVNTRLKSIDSLTAKAERKGVDLTLRAIRAAIHDIAGVRIVCSFRSDVYRIFELLTTQADVEVLEVEDYIEAPKANGYQSLHATVRIPVFLSTGPQSIPVEIQFRTVAMDFWASLEHKIFYKYDRGVPEELLAELKEAADTATRLDRRMERLHRRVHLPGEA